MNSFDTLRQCDPILAAAIEKVGPLEARENSNETHFAALCGIVIGQQLSTHVARAIRARFLAHFETLTPDAVAQTDIETLRGLGLSGAKTRALGALAAHIMDGQLQIERLETLSDEEVAREIVAVKGLGPWSADMFLMFHLNRPDVLPVGDLGIREAARRLYHLDERPDAARLTQIAEQWRPQRTLACRYLWRWLDS